MHDDAAFAYPEPDTGRMDTGGKDTARRRRSTRAALVAAAVFGAFFLGGLGVAFARTSPHQARLMVAPAAITPTQAPGNQGTGVPPSATTPATPANPGPGQGPWKHFGGHGGGHGGGPFGGHLFGRFGGFGGGPFGGLHGEFTMKKPDGSGYQTVASQTGEVTAVSPSSITVKSEDGFSRTYAVDENTLVGSGRDGIGTVKTGDTVHIAGIVEGGAAKAAAIMDSTQLGKIGEHWGFPHHK